MTVTRLELVGLVNDELENVALDGYAETTGDGATASYILAALGYRIAPGSVIATKDGVTTSALTMDYYTGTITFNIAPAASVLVRIRYKYLCWPMTLVGQAVDAAVDNLFPAFYVAKADTSISLLGDTYEYALAPAVQFITAVETRTSNTGAWTRMARSKYDWFSDGGCLNLRFFSAPSGYMRVRCINRAAPLVDDDTTLDDVGLPDRAKDPIISYACWYLLTQKMAPRVRSDIAVNTMGVGTLSPRQMADATQALLMRYQFQLAANKLPPWMAR